MQSKTNQIYPAFLRQLVVVTTNSSLSPLKSKLLKLLFIMALMASSLFVNAQTVGGTRPNDDFDGDGIINFIDLDDDNDGTLDLVESPSCFATLAEISRPTNISTEFAIRGTAGNIENAIDNDLGTRSLFEADQTMAGRILYKFESVAMTKVVSLSLARDGYAISSSSTSTFKLQGSVNDTDWVDMSAPLSSTGTSGTLTIPNTLATDTEFRYFRVIGIAGLCRYSAVSDISINVPSTHNQIFSNKFVCSADLDGDGKSNHHDLDADGDGCSDALEAGATTSTTADFKFSTAVGTNGIIDALETVEDNGVLNYTSTYFPYGLSRNIGVCVDTDGDGIKDIVDIDDDNDGILDMIESPNCFLTPSEWNTTDKSFFAKISSQLNTLAANSKFDALADGVGLTAAAVQFATATAQSQLNKELFKITLSSPTRLDAIYIQKTSATQIFAATAASLKVQGSNDDVSWTDLTAAIASPANATNETANGLVGGVPVSLTNSNKFVITTNAGAYKYYRIYGVVAANILAGIASEFYFDVNNATYQASYYPKVDCSSDIDSDGKLNHTDVDADGDGCFDILESAVATSSSTGVLAGPYGTNGFADALETSAGSGTYTARHTYAYAISPAINTCADLDADGIKDIDDFDIDNDGILNAVESPTCFNTLAEIKKPINISSELEIYQPTSRTIDFAIDESSATLSAFATGQNWVGKELFKFEAAAYTLITGLDLDRDSWALSANASSTFKLQGSQDNFVWSDLSAPLASTVATGTLTISNTLLPNVKFKYFRIIGVAGTSGYGGVKDIRINVPANHNVNLSPKAICETDDDSDNIPNHKDLDSDGDACFDAIEAGVLTTTTTGMVTGAVGTNGFDDTLETAGNGVYTGYYAYGYAINGFLNTCSDFDGDGVKDLLDLDDDNDGILDHVESPACFMTSTDIAQPLNVSTELTVYQPTTRFIEFTFDGSSTGVFGFATGQNWVGKILYNLEIGGYTPVSGLSLDLATWALSSASTSTFKLQGSSDNYNWSDLSAPVASTATTGTLTVNNTLLPTVKFKYLRLIGVAGTSGYGGVTEIRVNVPANSSPSASPRSSCTSDADGDTKLNHQDLDTDGDACPDAVEAGVLPKTNTSGIVPGTSFGLNGFADALETAENGLYNGLYYYEYAINSGFSNCIDTDNDGVSDVIDIDDDNDGVLDSDECNYPTSEAEKTALRYKMIRSSFHAMLIMGADGNYFAVGENAGPDGIADYSTPTKINTANGYNVSGRLIDAYVLGNQATYAYLTTDGLYLWGNKSSFDPDNVLTPSAALAKVSLPSSIIPAAIAEISGAGGLVSSVQRGSLGLRMHDGTINMFSPVIETISGSGLTTASSNFTKVKLNANTELTGISDFVVTTDGAFAYSKQNNKFYTWGSNIFLGNGSTVSTDRAYATEMVNPLPSGVTALKIQATPNYDGSSVSTGMTYLVLGSDKMVYTLGSGTNGITGQSDLLTIGTWTTVKNEAGSGPLTDVAFLSAQNSTNIRSTASVILSSGRLLSWGDNDATYGIIGHGKLASPTTLPTFPNGILATDDVWVVENGGHLTPVLKLNEPGFISNVGHNQGGAFGDGTTGDRVAYLSKPFSGALMQYCNPDLDGDGVPNRLDLDTDGDGCSDAIESGANREVKDIVVFPVGTDANKNGLLDSYEGTVAGTINYFSSYKEFGQVNTINSCADLDKDGVPDVSDIDDDNDGVPDVEEQKDCSYPEQSLPEFTFSAGAIASVDGNSINLVGGGTWKSSYSDQVMKLPIHLEWKTNTTGIGMIGLFPVGATKTPSNYTDGGYKVYHNGTNIYGRTPPTSSWSFNQAYVTDNLMEIDINKAGVGIIKQNGWVIKMFKATVSDYNLVVSSHTAKTFTDIKLTSYSPLAMVCTDIDTDGDGMVNRLDVDSDDDGCNDGVEAGAALAADVVPFTGPVGLNGLIDIKEITAEGGDVNYLSTYSSYAKNAYFNSCADTDTDGIGDLKDLDDDNDGLTDEMESACSNPLFVNQSAISTTALKQLKGVILKETGNINYELNMTGPAVAFTTTNYDVGNGLHFEVGDGGKLNFNLNFKLNSTVFENSAMQIAPQVNYVEFGPNVPQNTVPSPPVNEAQNIILTWPGAYGVIYDPFNQLSSHNTGDIIQNGDLITQDVEITAAQITARTTWKVRMYMHNESDEYIINANIFGDPTVAVQSYGFNLNACSIVDTDTDGILNTLDTDSDGDTCPDAFEGGATTSAATSVIPGPYGDNGLANSRESLDGIDAVINYDPTYNLALAKDLNKCADTDSDGIKNIDDIDDDNDGILDSEEKSCGAADFFLPDLVTDPAPTSNLQTVYGTLSKGNATADYEINLVGVKQVYYLSPITGPTAGSVELAFDNSKGGLHYFFQDDDNVFSQTLRIVPSSPSLLNKVEFGVNTPSNQLSKSSNIDAQSILMTWNPDVKAVVYDPDDQLSTHATGDIISSGATITTKANYTIANSTWKIEFLTNGSSEQFFLQTSHKSTSATNVSIEGFGINADLCYVNDTDGDSMPDYLDTDSDGDGCGDAYEAGATLTPGGATQTVDGPYGTNGFANSLEINDTQATAINYATTAYMAYSPVSACADSDSDSIPDIADIDDDNDGILDYEELACGVGTFVKSYVIKKGLSLSHGGSFNNGNAKGTGTFTYSNLSDILPAGVTDNSASSNFLVNDANGAYSMKASISPTNGLLSRVSFGPNLLGNSANGAVLNAAQSITLSWNLPIGAVVYDPDDQLSSHADGDAINPGGVLITRQAYTVAASTWKVVLPLPYLNSDVLFSIDYNSVTDFDQESFGFAVDICTKNTDPDADGKANHIDTDSDGDGCSDYVEAKSGRVLTDVTIASPYGSNGLSSLVESDDTQFATTNYTTLPNYLDEKVRGCLDTDGDAVANIDDLDDDNDGILDQVECPVVPPVKDFTFSAPTSNPSSSDPRFMFVHDKASGVIIGKITITPVKNMVVKSLVGNELDYSASGHWVDGSTKSSVDRVMTIKFEPVAPYTSLALKVLATEGGNGKYPFHPRSLRVDGGIAGNGVIKAIPQRYYLREKYNVGDVITPSMKMTTAFSGALSPSTNKVFISVLYGAVTTVDNPLVLTYTWNALAGTVGNENFGFQLMDMNPSFGSGPCDTDSDGIPDDLDNDSDNDGCSDANEEYNLTTAQGTDGNMYYGAGTPPSVSADGKVIAAAYPSVAATPTTPLNRNLSVINVGKVSTISTQPVDQDVAVGGSATFSSIASSGSGITTYKWQITTDGGASWTDIAGTTTSVTTPNTTSTLNYTVSPITAAMASYSYRLMASQSNYVCGEVYSNSVKFLFANLPTIIDDNFTTLEDSPVSGSVFSNDRGSGGSALTVTQFTIAGVTGTFTAGQTATIPNVGTIEVKADGTFSFTPVANYSGAVPAIDYTAVDANGGTDVGTLKITITAVNDAPVAVDDVISTNEDTPVSGNVLTNDTDADGDTKTVTNFTVDGVTYNAGTTTSIPGVGSIIVNTDGTFTFTPALDYSGTVPAITYTLSDGNGGSDTGQLTITVNDVNDPPLAAEDNVTTNAGTTASGNALTNDTDLEDNTLSISEITIGGVDYPVGSAVTLASGTLTVNADGTYTFVPASGFTGDVPPITYTLTDGTGTDPGIINIYVAPVNAPPVANPDTNTVSEDTPATGNVISNDTDAAGTTLTVTQISFEVAGTTYTYPAGTLSTIPGVGTIVVNTDGTYTFTPNSNWNGEVPTISYTLSDNDGATVVGTLDITVTAVNDDPIAVNDDNLVTPEDTPINGNVLTNDSDPEGLAITVSTFTIAGIVDGSGNPVVFTAGTTEASIPGVGTLVIGTDGAFTFTPEENYNGTVPVVTYTAKDSGGAEATATLNLSVTPVNEPPLAVNNLFTVADNTATNDQTPKTGNVLTNDSDPDGDTFKVTTFTVAGVSYPAGTVVTVPNIGNIILNEDGTFTFTPLPGNDDPLEISYTVTDSKGLSSTATLKVEVELLDSDGDGVPDFQEKIDGTNIYDSCDYDPDNQIDELISDAWKLLDCDGDGVTNGKELDDNTSPLDPCSYAATSFDATKVTSTWKALDCDNDGLTNGEELTLGTDPKLTDSDGDGNPDGTDPHPTTPTASNDVASVSFGTSVSVNVLDNDDYLPGTTTTLTKTGGTAAGTVSFNPLTGEMTYTPTESESGKDVTVTYQVCNGTVCTTATVTISVLGVDSDGDGVPYAQEILDGTNPNDPCDYDLGSQTLTAVGPNWNNADCDNDGITNAQELVLGTDPLNADSDGDGVSDGKEVADATDPNDPCEYKTTSQNLNLTSATWKATDCDEDGLTNAEELALGTDPQDADTDGDGNPDGTDPHPLVPTATDDTSSVNVNAVLEFNILTNDDYLPGANTTLTLVSTGTTAAGTIAMDPLTGKLTYTPVAGEADQTVTIVYQVCNGSVCDTAVLTINVVGVDTDGDGVSDLKETSASTPTSPTDPCSYNVADQSADAVSDTWKALDCDGDGVTNGVELADGTNPKNGCDYVVASQIVANVSTSWSNGDCDSDGLTNGEELTGVDNTSTPANPDGDKTNPSNPDSDGDGVSDAKEAIDGTNPNDPCSFTLASQTIATSDAWKALDCDGDGVTNEQEILDNTNPTNPCSYNSASQNSSLVSTAWSNADCDNDGLTNGEELTGVDNPLTTANPNGEVTNPLNPDSDGDGVSDAQEAIDGTDPIDGCDYKVASQDLTKVSAAWSNTDCDNDGLTNGEELTGVNNPATPANPNGEITNPLNPDSDGDGVSDAQEAIDGTDPNDPCKFVLANQNPTLISDTWYASDCDGDGLSNKTELDDSTNLLNPDSDGDGNPDNTDPNPLVPTAKDDEFDVIVGFPIAVNILTNDDYLPNDGNTITQIGGTALGTVSFDPATGIMTYVPDASETLTANTVTVVYEVCQGTGANQVCSTATVTLNLDVDVDGDGVGDAKEVIDVTDPTDPCDYNPESQLEDYISDAWKAADCDEDGLSNGAELLLGTDPLNKDTDGDGIPDNLDKCPLVPAFNSMGCPITNDINVTNISVPVSGSVATNDVVPAGTTYGTPVAETTNPAGATITMKPDGTYEFKATEPGVYTYMVPVCAPGQTTGCPLSPLEITVLEPIPAINAPVVNPDVATTEAGSAVTISILSNDKTSNAGIELDIKTLEITEQPENGVVKINEDGTVTYTPNVDFEGTDVFTYKVCDNANPVNCQTAEVTVTVVKEDLKNIVSATDDFAVMTSDPSGESSLSGNVLTNDGSSLSGVLLTASLVTNPTTLPGTLVFNPDGSYTFKPETGFAGPVDVVYTVCDDATPANCATATLHILVEPAPQMPVDLNVTNINVPVSGSVATNDAVPAGTTYGTPVAETTNPAGATITMNPDGTYEFKATEPGVYTYMVPVCAPGQTTDCPLSPLQITVLDPMVNDNAPVVNPDIATAKEDSPVTIAILSNDKSGNVGTELDPTTLTITEQPENGTVTVNADGTVTFTPDADFVGTDVFTYKVCDTSNPAICQTAEVTVTVLPEDAKDVTTAPDDYAVMTADANGKSSVSGNVLTNDDSTDPNAKLTASLVSGPTAAQGTLVFNADGTYTFTAAPGFAGPVEVVYTVCDDATPANCATATLHILVEPAPQMPVDLNVTDINVPVKGSVATNDVVPAGTTYGTPVAETTNPAGATITMNADGTYEFKATEPGVYTYMVPVCALGQTTDCPLSPLQITVLDPIVANNAPVVNPDIATTEEDSPVTIAILSNDKSGNVGTELDPKSLTITEQPENGTVTVNADGTVTFTPDAGFVGTDVFTYKVCDTSNPAICQTAEVTVTVIPEDAKDVTTAPDDYAVMTADANGKSSVSGNVLTNDDSTNPDAKLTASLVEGPTAAQGTLVFNADGTYTFTAAPGFAGPVEVIYTVCDDATPANCATATLHILVEPAPQMPVDLNVTDINVPVKGSVATNDVVPAGTTYGTPVAETTNPAGATITMNADGTYEFKATEPGVYTYMVPVCAPGQTTDCPLVSLQITVLESVLTVNAPVINPDGTQTKQDVPVKISVLANDNSGNVGSELVPSTLTITEQPKNGTVTVNADGTVVFTPKAGFTGTDVFTYSVCDNSSPAVCNTAEVNVTVLPADVAPKTTAIDDYESLVGGIGVPVSVSGNVLTNDASTNPVAKLTASLVSGPTAEQGTLVFNADGTYTFTAAAAFTGPVEVVYTVCDAATPANCATATLHILVQSGDSDGDGVPNEQEIADGTDPNNGCDYLAENQILSLVTAAWKSTDCDKDGLTNYEEVSGINDPSTPANPNGIKTNPLNPDSDGDGVTDSQEALDGTNPNDGCDYKLSSQVFAKVSQEWLISDCDKDGLTNGEEMTGVDFPGLPSGPGGPGVPADPNGIKTDPRNPDSDGDGVSDAQEALDKTNPNDGCDYKAASQDLTKVSAAWKSADCDKDGLTNGEEVTGIDDPATPANPNGIKTDPRNPDSDGDGVSDAQEALDKTNPNDGCDYKVASQVLANVSAAWKSTDCDKDGLTNGEEVSGIDDPATPANPNGIKTDPRNPDSDGDGVSDAQEALDKTNPNDPCSFKLASQTLTPNAAWNNGDCDGDGVTNGKEKSDGTDPLDGCSLKVTSITLTPSDAWKNGDCDGDGLKNEVDGIEDCDKDGTPNFLDPDSCNIDILMANVFTPNGDGINDEIKPVLLGIDKFVCFKVYNRWGNLVFETKDREKGWNGNFRTQGQGTETFQWLAEGYDRDGKLVKRTGMITLLR